MARNGSRRVGGQPKDLLQHVLDRTFIPKRHEDLLEDDETLDHVPAEWAESDIRWVRLMELVLYYRHAARTPSARRNVALAFRDGTNGDWKRYHELMDPWCWTRDDETGQWQLIPYDPEEHAEAAKEAVGQLAVTLAEGYVEIVEKNPEASDEELAQECAAFTTRTARRLGWDEDEETEERVFDFGRRLLEALESDEDFETAWAKTRPKRRR